MITYKLFTKKILQVDVQEVQPVSWAEPSTTKRKLKPGKFCTMCPRHKTRIVGEGDDERLKAIELKPVLLAPTDPDDKRTLLAVVDNTTMSKSIDWLAAEIRDAGFGGQVVIDFAVKCGGGRVDKVKDNHIRKCQPHLAYTYHATVPDLVLLCGTRSTKAFLGETVSVHKNTDLWQVIFEKDRQIPVVMTQSAIEALGNYLIRRNFRRDLHRLFNADWDSWRLPRGEVRVVENDADAKEALAWAREAPWLAYDTETKGRFFKGQFEVLCTAFASPHSNITYVFGLETNTNEFILEVVRKILTKAKLVGHNVKYDQHAVREGYGVEAKRIIGCTRLMHKLQNSDADASLEQLSRCVGIGNHKRQMDPEVKKIASKLRAKANEEAGRKLKKHEYEPMSEAYAHVDLEDLYRYCALDTYVTMMLYVKFKEDLKNHEFLWSTWTDHQLEANAFFYRMEKRGVPASKANIELAHKYVSKKVDESYWKLQELTSFELDPDKPASLVRFLERNSLDTGKRTDTGKMSTASKDLKAIRNKHTALAHMLDYRKGAKLLSSYIETLPHYIGADGCVHPSVLVDGTRSGGRVSMSSPSLQVIPSGKDDLEMSKMVKNCFVAPNIPGEDYEAICADFKTLEIYVGAAWANDDVMISALKSGKDFHIHTAMGIAPYVWKQTAEEVYEEIMRDLASPSGSSAKRTMSKRLTFSTMYGMRERTLAEELGIPVPMAKDMIDAFFKLNHGLASRMDEALAFARKHGIIYAEWDGVPFRQRPLTHIGYKDAYRYNSAENASKNTPIQSQAADICTRAGFELEAELNQLPRNEAWIALTVHDSIMVMSRRRSSERVMNIMRDCMTRQPCGGIELKVDIEIGKAWGSMISEKAWRNGETYKAA